MKIANNFVIRSFNFVGLPINPLNPEYKSHVLFASIIRNSPFSPR